MSTELGADPNPNGYLLLNEWMNACIDVWHEWVAEVGIADRDPVEPRPAPIWTGPYSGHRICQRCRLPEVTHARAGCEWSATPASWPGANGTDGSNW